MPLMAKDYALQLLILHVVTETPPYFVAEAGTPPENLLADTEAEGRQILAAAAARAAADVTFTTELSWGRVPEVVCRTAQEQACDLIIVGSRALKGFKRLMIGSISNAIASKAPCPILIVKWHESS